MLRVWPRDANVTLALPLLCVPTAYAAITNALPLSVIGRAELIWFLGRGVAPARELQPSWMP